MSYTVDALGDFMRVGPQVYPARPNGVQVIMRGPHGQRLAADPVRTREGRARGSGFRFWVEQLNVPADEKWNPKQKVVGLLGLGAIKRSTNEAAFVRVYQEFRSASNPEVRRAWAVQARSAVWPALTPDEKANYAAEMQVMAAAINDKTVYHEELSTRPDLTSQESLDASRERLETARRAADAARRRGGENWWEQLERPEVPAPGFKFGLGIGLGSVALLVAGGIAIYAFAGSAGRGLSERLFSSKKKES